MWFIKIISFPHYILKNNAGQEMDMYAVQKCPLNPQLPPASAAYILNQTVEINDDWIIINFHCYIKLIITKNEFCFQVLNDLLLLTTIYCKKQHRNNQCYLTNSLASRFRVLSHLAVYCRCYYELVTMYTGVGRLYILLGTCLHICKIFVHTFPRTSITSWTCRSLSSYGDMSARKAVGLCHSTSCSIVF